MHGSDTKRDAALQVIDAPRGSQEVALGAANAGASGQPSSQPPLSPLPASAPESSRWRHRNVLDLDDFGRDEIMYVLETTDAMREVLARDVPRVPALRGTTVATLFYEASTRTRASFELAGKVLGADVINLSSSGSSVEKGESLVDTVRTLQALGVNIVVIRHGNSGAPYLAATHTTTAVINGGDGWHAHPTQSLLDLYTMRTHLGDLRGRKVAIVGDIAHSRVARSDIWGLTALGADVVLCAPPTLLPFGLGRRVSTEQEEIALPGVTIEREIERALKGADVVMTLRLQRERQQAGLLPSLREYSRRYEITRERVALAAADALVMHPGPMNEGVEIATDVAASAQSRIEEQVTNGVAVRMALLYLIGRGGVA
jgi:aspartate carbamoyltransferase catalytic subunit